jgi:hypothetical protein
MQKLKVWWSTLKWWQKGLLALPVGLLALALLVRALWPRARSPVPKTPATPIPPSTGAQAVETKLDVILANINEEVKVAKEKAKNAKEAIAEADDLAGVDAILYGRKPEGK